MQLAQWLLRRRFLSEFPIGSYVKLSSAVGAILIEGFYISNLGTFWLKIEQFWPFEEISIFSNGGHLGYRTALMDEKIFFKFHPPFFLFLAWRPSWLEVGITGHNFGRGPSKDHSSKVWLQLAQCFLRRFFLISSPLFSNLHNRSKWVMGFTSKLQGR